MCVSVATVIRRRPDTSDSTHMLYFLIACSVLLLPLPLITFPACVSTDRLHTHEYTIFTPELLFPPQLLWGHMTLSNTQHHIRAHVDSTNWLHPEIVHIQYYARSEMWRLFSPHLTYTCSAAVYYIWPRSFHEGKLCETREGTNVFLCTIFDF